MTMLRRAQAGPVDSLHGADAVARVAGDGCAAQPSPGGARASAALVITGGTVVTVDDQRRVLAPGAVAIAGTDIVGVGTPEEIAARFSAAETIDATGQVVLPGLINTHTHAAMVLYRGLGNDLNLQDWLTKYIFPAEGKTVSPEFVRAGTRLAALEMILGGTTTFVDMYYFEEEVAEATREAGLRGVLGQTIIQFPVRRREDARRRARARPDLHREVQGRRARHAGRGAAFDVHAERGRRCRRPIASRASSRCRC